MDHRAILGRPAFPAFPYPDPVGTGLGAKFGRKPAKTEEQVNLLLHILSEGNGSDIMILLVLSSRRTVLMRVTLAAPSVKLPRDFDASIRRTLHVFGSLKPIPCTRHLPMCNSANQNVAHCRPIQAGVRNNGSNRWHGHTDRGPAWPSHRKLGWNLHIRHRLNPRCPVHGDNVEPNLRSRTRDRTCRGRTR